MDVSEIIAKRNKIGFNFSIVYVLAILVTVLYKLS